MSYRKHLRLKEFDYSSSNYYFVTICTKNRERLFIPRISEKYGELFSVAAGPWPANAKNNTNVIEQKLQLLEEKFLVELDFYCIMFDHIHFILTIEEARQGRAATLSWIINAFKGWCTRELKKPIFQPNFYEHIVRDEKSLDNIRHYILSNPMVEYENIPWKTIDP